MSASTARLVRLAARDFRNLAHVEIKTEPVTPGSIDTTLKAAGRVTENQNKTAKIISTLEGAMLVSRALGKYRCFDAAAAFHPLWFTWP